MKDEVLQKALTIDSTVIPRYDILLPDGTKVAENVQLVLKNTILTAGTSLNKQTLLKDATATAYGMNSASAVPDDVLLAIRRTASYCPKLRITGQYNTTVYIQNMGASSPATYTITLANEITVDILAYGTYKIWGVLNGASTPETIIDIDTTKMYTVNVSSFVHYVKVTVTNEIGATISARSSDGYVLTGTINSSKTCTLPLFKTGTWSIFGTYSGEESNTQSIQVTGTMNGTTTEKSLTWS